MLLILNDWVETDIFNSDPFSTLVLGFSDPETRKMNLECLSQFKCQVVDLYRDDSILPNMLKIPCFARLIDYDTYSRTECWFDDYLNNADPEMLPPTVIYGTKGRLIIENLSLVDAAKIHPDLLSCFFRVKLKRF